MTDAVEIVQKEEPEETAPASALPTDVSAPPVGTAPASSDDLDSLLAEFDAATSKPADEPAQDNTGQDATELAKLIDDLGSSQERQQIERLTDEIGSLRAAEADRQSRADFEGFAAKLQKELGPHVDERFARTNLLAALAERPELATVWQYRHASDEQLRAADREFRQLEALYNRTLAAPDDPRKQQAIAALEQRGWQLGLMLNSRAILNKVWRDVQKKASKVLPPIDVEATADHDMVAQSVRDGSTPILPEPPVKWGNLSAREGRERIKQDFGFDPGWGW
jgi:hypothetical protein